MTFRVSLGLAYERQERDDLAQQAYIEAIKVCAWDPGEPHWRLGMLASKYGHSDQAIAQFRMSLNLEPNRVSTLIALGCELVQTGQFAEGLSYLEQARSRVNRPEQFTLYFHLGIAYEKLGRAQESIPAFKAAVDIAPEVVAARLGLARVLARSGHTREALDQLATIRKLDPANTGAQQLMQSITTDRR